jgi:hypothetical protein
MLVNGRGGAQTRHPCAMIARHVKDAVVNGGGFHRGRARLELGTVFSGRDPLDGNSRVLLLMTIQYIQRLLLISRRVPCELIGRFPHL